MANKAQARMAQHDQGVGGPSPHTPTPEPAAAKSFFQTLPGILTATAAVITALGGLLVGLHQTGPAAADKQAQVLGQATNASTTPGKPAASPANNLVQPNPSVPVGTAGTHQAGVPVSAPGAPSVTASINSVKLGDVVTKILSARVEPESQNSFTLRLATRETNEGSYTLYWGSNCCRIIIDDVPRAPTEHKSLTVPTQAAEDGEMAFSVPNGTSAADLRLIVGDKDTRIHLQFAAPK
jgi:hypothetical protein